MTIFKYIIAVTSLIAVCSCSLLEPIDENLDGEDRLSYDPSFAEGLLMNAYASMPNQFQYTDAATDDAVNNVNSIYRKLAIGEWSAINCYTNRWSNYKQVLYINKFLTVIDSVSWKFDEDQNKLFIQRNYGEAIAMRALHHYWILQEHAGVGESGELMGIPYITTFLEFDDDFNMPRLTFKETIEAINNDFNEALEYIPLDYDGSISGRPARYEGFKDEDYTYIFGKDQAGRISGRIIKAYQAKLAILAASPAFLNGADKQYEKAADLLAQLIEDNGGVAGLDPDGTTNFYQFEEKTKKFPEILWRSSVGSGWTWIEKLHFPPSMLGKAFLNPTQDLVDAFPMIDGYPFSPQHSQFDATNIYANRDPRLKDYILYYGNTMDGRALNLEKDGVDAILGQSTRSGYYLKKLLDETYKLNADGSESKSEKMNIYLRYTDIYLLFAEAANEVGGPDAAINGITAREVIAAIRKRAGIGAANNDAYLATITSKEAMRVMIRNERRLELCFEGHRFYDLRRWGIINTLSTVHGIYHLNGSYAIFNLEPRVYGEHSNYGPIPNSEIVKFSALEQNKGW